MKINKYIATIICTNFMLSTQPVFAETLNINEYYTHKNTLERSSNLNEDVISYGLLPNPFKIVTAPVRAAKAKIKAAKKAAKIAKKATHAAKEIGGDNEGKEPTGDYERTPYTKDRYYQRTKNKKTNRKPAKNNFEDYQFENDTTKANDTTVVIERRPITNNKSNTSTTDKATTIIENKEAVIINKTPTVVEKKETNINENKPNHTENNTEIISEKSPKIINNNKYS